MRKQDQFQNEKISSENRSRIDLHSSNSTSTINIIFEEIRLTSNIDEIKYIFCK